MAYHIQRAGYFSTTVADQPGEAYKLLSVLAARGIHLVAFTAVPVGAERTQLTMFPQDARQLQTEAGKAGLDLDGPHPAVLVQGDDELGALAGVHMKLYASAVNVYASSGVADGRGSFSYVIYLRPEDGPAAFAALGL
jgi:hypothetical protein